VATTNTRLLLAPILMIGLGILASVNSIVVRPGVSAFLLVASIGVPDSWAHVVSTNATSVLPAHGLRFAIDIVRTAASVLPLSCSIVVVAVTIILLVVTALVGLLVSTYASSQVGSRLVVVIVVIVPSLRVPLAILIVASRS
jgi:hypothetical protein